MHFQAIFIFNLWKPAVFASLVICCFFSDLSQESQIQEFTIVTMIIVKKRDLCISKSHWSCYQENLPGAQKNSIRLQVSTFLVSLC